jgi:predicted RNA binding protein YcfA (HicA-like mRNA interferase family)
MSKRDKLRRKLRNNPRDATMQEVETLLLRFDFVLERVSGSHHIYRYNGVPVRKIVIPLHGRKVKEVYVKRAIDLLDTIFPADELYEEDNDE